jgi:hypothetical protein
MRLGAMKTLRVTLALSAVALLVVAACSSGASPTSITAGGAVTAVLAQDPKFAGLTPLDPNLIGQSGYYEVQPAADGGYAIRVWFGWGDCPAGCINHHEWQYGVSASGAVTLLGEVGDSLPDVATGLRGTVTAGPTCPVVQNPPDPACADRPVADAVILVTNAAGDLIMRITTGADGTYDVPLGPGVYTLTPRPVEGLMGTPEAQLVRLEAGEGVVIIDFSYDTGIR